MTGEEALGATAHSLKSTMLSWANQLDIPEHLRSLQGHHRASGGKRSAQLYSRDDVFGALRVQQSIWQHVQQGFRPAAPQSRGGRPPLKERPIPRDCLAARTTYDWMRGEQEVPTQRQEEIGKGNQDPTPDGSKDGTIDEYTESEGEDLETEAREGKATEPSSPAEEEGT